MIQTCRKCSDYYEGESLRFCPAEGGKLEKVDPNGPTWNEAVRVTQQKAEVLRRKQFRFKLCHTFEIVTTVLITTLLVCVVIVNVVIYFR